MFCNKKCDYINDIMWVLGYVTLLRIMVTKAALGFKVLKIVKCESSS